MEKKFIGCLIGSVICLLIGSLILGFDVVGYFGPFAITLILLSVTGIIVFGVLWLIAKTTNTFRY